MMTASAAVGAASSPMLKTAAQSVRATTVHVRWRWRSHASGAIATRTTDVSLEHALATMTATTPKGRRNHGQVGRFTTGRSIVTVVGIPVFAHTGTQTPASWSTFRIGATSITRERTTGRRIGCIRRVPGHATSPDADKERSRPSKAIRVGRGVLPQCTRPRR